MHRALDCTDCKDGSGMTHTSTLSSREVAACARIGNNNGELKCELNREPHEEPVDSGRKDEL